MRRGTAVALVDPVDPNAIMVAALRPGGPLIRVTKQHADRIAARARVLAPVASGQLRGSIKVTQQRAGGGRFTRGFTVVADVPYSLWVERGRGPGRMPPVDAIRRWTVHKGIDPSAAFPIARKIGRVGTKPTYFMSRAVAQTPFAP